MPSARRSVIAFFVALVLAAVLSPLARSQIQAAPSYVPIGVASSGSTSTAWFHEPSTRQALACQTVVTPNTGLSSIQCIAAKLP
jgi:hypothetical protein